MSGLLNSFKECLTKKYWIGRSTLPFVLQYKWLNSDMLCSTSEQLGIKRACAFESQCIWTLLFWETTVCSPSVITILFLMIKILLLRHQVLSRNCFCLCFGSFRPLNRRRWAKSHRGMVEEYFRHQSRGSGYTSMVLAASFTGSIHFCRGAAN